MPQDRRERELTTITPTPKPSSVHSELQRDLEVYFRHKNPPWVVAREVDLGSRSIDREVKRVDILAMSVTYPPRFIICEVKVSRQDFFRDIESEKYLHYMENCNLFYFVTPFSLVLENEIPSWCGWIERSFDKKRFTEHDGEKNNAFKMPEEVWHSFVKRLAG